MKVLRLRDVIGRTGLSRSTIWRLERRNMFPSRIQLSENAVGWPETDVTLWLAKRPRGLPSQSQVIVRRRLRFQGARP
jgi:prophage regulatory protein